GVALAYAIHEYLRTPLLWLYVGRTGPVQARHVLRATLPFVMGAHVAVGAVMLLAPHLPANPVAALLLATLASYGIVAGVGALFAAGRDTLAEIWTLASKALSSRTHNRMA
ncbi:MAG: lipopolysaccharide biosynthesis protein, partial [Paracoccus sp. (in: a-proteobacteria)]